MRRVVAVFERHRVGMGFCFASEDASRRMFRPGSARHLFDRFEVAVFALCVIRHLVPGIGPAERVLRSSEKPSCSVNVARASSCGL